MAGNQREMERREKRERKDKRRKLVIWIIIAVIVFALAVMKICEVNINSIVDRFTDENGRFTLTEGVVTDNFPYSIDSSQNVKMVNANNKIGVITPNSYTVLDSKDATADYVFEHGYSNPILANAGVYSLVYDQGAKKYRLDTLSQPVYEEESANSIICADVSKNGTVALATTSSEKLCDITVYSKSLKNELSLGLSDGYIIDIALNDSADKVAVAVVNSENADLKTTVYTYNVGSDGTVSSKTVLPSGVLYDLCYAGSNIWAVGSDYLGVVKNGEYKETYAQGTINIECFTYNTSGDVVLAYGNYSNSSQLVVSCVKSSGKIRNEFNFDGNIKSVTATTSLISILTNDEIITYNLKNGELRESLQISDSAKSICRIGSSVFIHKQSVIDKSEVLR